MNKLFALIGLVMAILAMPNQSFAMPIPANVEFRLNHGTASGGPGVMLGYQVISNKVQLLRCTYDFAVLGGSSAAALSLRAPDGSVCKLPNKAIVKQALIDVVTALNSTSFTGIATVALGTGQAANDIKTATTYSTYSAVMAGIPVGTAATAIKMTAERTPTITIATRDLSAGKINVFIEYLLSN